MRLERCMMGFRSALIAGLVVAVPACAGDGPAGPVTEPTAARTVGGLEVSVTLSANRLPAGGDLSVTVRARNVTAHPLAPELGPCLLTFAVADGGGADVIPPRQGCPLILVTPQLGPGEAYEFTFTWDGMRAGPTRDPVPAGTYYVRGGLDLRDRLVETPAVPVDVMAPGSAGEIQGAATVRWAALEGGFFYLAAEDGTAWLPMGLPDAYRKDGLQVLFRGVPRPDIGTFAMFGTPLELTDIRPR